MHTITPMVVARGPQREKSRFTYMHNFGEKVDIPYVSWLIEGGSALVLVDTGCSAEAYRTRIRGDEPVRQCVGSLRPRHRQRDRQDPRSPTTHTPDHR